MQIYILGAVLIFLAGLLGFIIIRTVAMVRARRPLIAIGPIAWHARPARSMAPRVPQPLADAAPASYRGQAAPGASQALPHLPARTPPRPRERSLASVSELALAKDQFPAVEAGFYAQIEQRLEASFDALCDGTISPDVYLARIDGEFAEVRRIQGRLGPLAADALHAEVAEAVAALQWCRDWALQHAANHRPV